MKELNEHIEFLEMTEDNPQLLVWLLELRRHRENGWQQRAEAAEAKLAEYEKQEITGWRAMQNDSRDSREPLYLDSSNEPTGWNSEYAPVYSRPSPVVNLAELVPDENRNCPKQGSHEWVHHVPCYKDEYEECNKCGQRRNIEGRPADAAQTLNGKRIEFIQSLAEDPELLRGKSGLMRYKFDQHGFPVDGCIENATHYVARLIENGIVTHYAKSLYDFQEAIK